MDFCAFENNVEVIFYSSPEEAGRYLETLKAYEHKPPDMIMEKVESNFMTQVRLTVPSRLTRSSLIVSLFFS